MTIRTAAWLSLAVFTVAVTALLACGWALAAAVAANST